jgi:hypothetical protein
MMTDLGQVPLRVDEDLMSIVQSFPGPKNDRALIS